MIFTKVYLDPILHILACIIDHVSQFMDAILQVMGHLPIVYS